MQFICLVCEGRLQRVANGGKMVVPPVCKNCNIKLTAELGPEWENEHWFQELKKDHYRTQSLRNQEYDRTVPLQFTDALCGLDGQIMNQQGSVENIIRRLYQTYGYGNRRIYSILTSTYRQKVSRRKVSYVLERLKESGIKPDRDAHFWRNWHMSLRRLTREEVTTDD